MNNKENKSTKKRYPILPYLLGLFIAVIMLVVLSYLAELRNNKQELSITAGIPQYTIEESSNAEN